MRDSRKLHTSAGRSSDSYDFHSSSLATVKLESARKRLLSNLTVRSRQEQDLYVVRLESQLLELEKTVETQKIQIAGLLEEKYCLHEICRKQQEKLQMRFDEGEMMVEELTRELEVLRMERQRANDVMQVVSAEKQAEMETLQQRLHQTTQQIIALEREVLGLRSRNAELSQQIEHRTSKSEASAEIEKELEELRCANLQLQEELQEKRYVERKFRMSLQEIERLERALLEAATSAKILL